MAEPFRSFLGLIRDVTRRIDHLYRRIRFGWVIAGGLRMIHHLTCAWNRLCSRFGSLLATGPHVGTDAVRSLLGAQLLTALHRCCGLPFPSACIDNHRYICTWVSARPLPVVSFLSGSIGFVQASRLLRTSLPANSRSGHHDGLHMWSWVPRSGLLCCCVFRFEVAPALGAHKTAWVDPQL